MKLDERFQAYHGELLCPDSSQVHDALTGDVVADFPSPREPRDSPLARRQAARATFLATTLNSTPRLRVGMTVRARTHIERFPHFLLTPGVTGVVTEIDSRASGSWSVWVHMDDDIGDGCVEWDNEVNVWSDMYCEDVDVREGFGREFVPTGYAEYRVNGAWVDLAGLLEQDGLSPDERTALRGLRVGESVTIGGGAFATSTVTRVA